LQDQFLYWHWSTALEKPQSACCKSAFDFSKAAKMYMGSKHLNESHGINGHAQHIERLSTSTRPVPQPQVKYDYDGPMTSLFILKNIQR